MRDFYLQRGSKFSFLVKGKIIETYGEGCEEYCIGHPFKIYGMGTANEVLIYLRGTMYLLLKKTEGKWEVRAKSEDFNKAMHMAILLYNNKSIDDI